MFTKKLVIYVQYKQIWSHNRDVKRNDWLKYHTFNEKHLTNMYKT